MHYMYCIARSGASSGIGRHAAEYLARRGYTVYAGVRKAHDAESIKSAGHKNLFPLLIDVSKHASIAQAVASLAVELKRLDLPLVGVVNNAGVADSFAAEV
jgi:NADP-dependent 3-hydroxy acid dehydrogenase YdfG